MGASLGFSGGLCLCLCPLLVSDTAVDARAKGVSVVEVGTSYFVGLFYQQAIGRPSRLSNRTSFASFPTIQHTADVFYLLYLVGMQRKLSFSSSVAMNPASPHHKNATIVLRRAGRGHSPDVRLPRDLTGSNRSLMHATSADADEMPAVVAQA